MVDYELITCRSRCCIIAVFFWHFMREVLCASVLEGTQNILLNKVQYESCFVHNYK